MPSNYKALRRIAPTTAADPNWGSLQRPIGPAVSITGVDADGPHSFDVAGVTISHTRTGAEGPAEVADALAAAASLLLGTTLKDIITAADSDSDSDADGVAHVYLTPFQVDGQQADPFEVDNFVVQGGASIASSPGGEFPITGLMPHGQGGVEFTLRLVDSADALVGDNLTFADLEVVLNDTQRDIVSVVSRAPAHRLIEPLRAVISGGSKFSLRLASPISSPPSNLDGVIVEWAPVTGLS